TVTAAATPTTAMVASAAAAVARSVVLAVTGSGGQVAARAGGRRRAAPPPPRGVRSLRPSTSGQQRAQPASGPQPAGRESEPTKPARGVVVALPSLRCGRRRGLALTTVLGAAGGALADEFEHGRRVLRLVAALGRRWGVPTHDL